jgi:hypothetical protein
LAYVTIAPGAVAFAMAYSDSLFLLLAVGTFLAAEHRRWPLMAVLLAAATLTRLPGVLISVPLALLILRDDGASNRKLLWLAAAPVALAGLCAFQAATLGDPLAFLTAQSSWNFPSRAGALSEGVVIPFDPVPVLLTAVLAFHVFLLVYARADRIPPPYVALSVVGILTVLGSLRLLSVSRYMAVLWPFDWILAGRRAPWFRATWPIVSAGLFVLFAVLHFTESMAP